MAFMWARKELEVDKYCVGHDHPDYAQQLAIINWLEKSEDGPEPLHESVIEWYGLANSGKEDCVVM